MKDLAKSINLNDYSISTKEFTSWVIENGMDVYAVATTGGNGSKIYFFQNLEDFTAFTLKFSKRLLPADFGFYYCPYIPVGIK